MNAKNQIIEIPLKQLKGSPTNPRKTFDEVKLKELAESFKTSGQLAPALVRTWTKPGFKGFEIIAGERRFRAATKAGFETLRCELKELDDRAVAEFQLIENVQRDDLAPMEEAEAYGHLVDDLKMKMEEIAVRTGKSRAYISGRLGLLSLSPKVRAAVASGALQLTWALEMRRVANSAHQEELLARIIGKGRGRSVDSFRELKEVIGEDYLLELADAAFSLTDEKLVAGAGACTACPKRTGAQSDLFGADAKRDTCLDGACFSKKVLAHAGQLAKKAKDEGRKVLTGAEAKAMISKSEDWDSPMKDISKHCHDLRLQGDHTFKKLLEKHDKGHLVEVIVALDDHGRAHELVKRKDFLAAMPKDLLNSSSGGQKISKGEAQARVRKAITNKASRAAWSKAWPMFIDKMKAKPFAGALLRQVLGLAVVHHMDYKAGRGPLARFAQLNGKKAPNQYQGNVQVGNSIIGAKTDKEALEIFFHVVLGDGLSYFNPSELDSATKAALKMAGIDFAPMVREAIEDLKTAKKEKKPAAPAPGPGKKVVGGKKPAKAKRRK